VRNWRAETLTLMYRGPAEVAAHPTEVGGAAHVPGAVELDQAVGHVGEQEPRGTEAEKIDRTVAPDAAGEQPREDRQGQHVAEGIRDRHQLLHQRQLVAAHVRVDN